MVRYRFIMIFLISQNPDFKSYIIKTKEDTEMSVSKIGKENFANEVLNSKKPVLLDFFAVWCGPCRMVGPIVSEIAKERNDGNVGKFHVDEQPKRAARF